MASKTDICNTAVSWLGGNFITNVDTDETEEADLCRRNYNRARDAVLEARDWTFATKAVQLSPLSTTPDFGWSYQFLKPSDCIRIMEVSSDSQFLNFIEWEIQGANIMSNYSTIYIKYIERGSRHHSFLPWLHLGALRFSGFSYSCSNIGQPADEKKDMAGLYDVYLNDGGTMDGMQGRRKEIKSFKLTGVR